MRSSLQCFNGSTSKSPDLVTRYWKPPAYFSTRENGPLSGDFRDRDPEMRLPSTIVGWQVLGHSSSSYYEYWLKESQQDDEERWKNMAGNMTREILPAVFHLNSSISTDSLSTLPYNSTIWYNRTGIPLQAPFLEFEQGCRWSSSPLGECICYKGKPVTEDFRVESQLVCTSEERYYWGFSSFFAFIGLGLEIVWCLVVAYLLSSSTQDSTLLRMGRPTVGSVRNILDIAEVINTELGDNTCLYRDHELKRELSQCPPVGYTITERKEGVKHLGLVAVPDGCRRIRSIQIDRDDEACYG